MFLFVNRCYYPDDSELYKAFGEVSYNFYECHKIPFL